MSDIVGGKMSLKNRLKRNIDKVLGVSYAGSVVTILGKYIYDLYDVASYIIKVQRPWLWPGDGWTLDPWPIKGSGRRIELPLPPNKLPPLLPRLDEMDKLIYTYGVETPAIPIILGIVAVLGGVGIYKLCKRLKRRYQSG